MAQLMPLPLTVSCFSKIQIGFTLLVPAYLGSPGKGPLNGCVCRVTQVDLYNGYETMVVVVCSIGVEVLQLYASDRDDGVHSGVTFSLVEPSSLFQVSSDGRITTIAPASSFDRESRDTYYLTVRASDGGSPPTTGMFVSWFVCGL